jgi:hypothetical protein
MDEEWLHTYYLLYMYIHIRELIIKHSCEKTIWTHGIQIDSNKLGNIEVLDVML